MDTLAPPRDAQTELLSDDEQLVPRRPRRKLLNRRSAALATVATCAIGFYAGVRVEKGQLASTPSALTFGAGARTAGAGGTGAAGRTGAAATGATGAGAAGTAGTGAAGSAATGAAGRAGASLFGGGAAGGAGSFGTVQSVNGNTIVLSEASGNTVQVRLSSATKVSKTQSVGRSAVRPGDTVIVEGITDSKGTLVAARVTDSGSSSAGTTGSSGTSGATGTTGSGSSSAVGSLFSSGGGG